MCLLRGLEKRVNILKTTLPPQLYLLALVAGISDRGTPGTTALFELAKNSLPVLSPLGTNEDSLSHVFLELLP